MERFGNCAYGPGVVQVVCTGHVVGRCLLKDEPQLVAQHGLLCQRAADFQRCAGLGKTFFVEQLPFALIIRALD